MPKAKTDPIYLLLAVFAAACASAPNRGQTGGPPPATPSFSVAWTRTAPLLNGVAPTISAARVYFMDESGTLHVAGLADGKDIASHAHPEWYKPVLLAGKEGVYVATQIGAQPAPADGRPPRILGQEIMRFSEDGKDIVWKSGLPQPMAGTPSLEADALYVSTVGGTTYRVPREGPPELNPIAHGLRVASRVARIGSQLCFGTTDGALVWVDVASARVVRRLEGFDAITAGPVQAGDAVYFGTAANYLYRADKGKIEWRMRTSGDIQEGLIVLPDAVIAASRDSRVYALNEKNGNTIWRARLPNRVIYPPKLWGTHLAVTVWNDPRVFILDLRTGRELATHPRLLTGAPVSAPPLLSETKLVVWNGAEASCLTLR